VVNAEPPRIDEIDAAFKVRGKPVLFAFGEMIYNPAGVEVPPELLAHEEVHGERQRALGSVDVWWDRYLADPAFRLAEELPAHVAEFEKLCSLYRYRWQSARAMRRTFAAHVARKLAAPL